MDFLIVVTGYNCAQFVKPCLDSIKAQTINNYRVIIVDDASQDNTYHEIKKHEFAVMKNIDNMGAAYSRDIAIYNYAKKEDIVLLLGLDDELLPDALETILKQYQAGKWMTYGNWINQYGVGLPRDFPLHFDKETHFERNYRKVKYRSTAPNTFYAKLYLKIPEDDFKLDGKWLDTTTESEIMFSCLEMCGEERIGVIEKPIYKYNQNLPNGTQRRLGQDYKNSVYKQIIERPKKPLYEDC